MKFKLFVICSVIILITCQLSTRSAKYTIRLKGSYTMLDLANKLAAEYMAQNPGVSIYTEGGGTATGFKGLAQGSTDIALASRLIRSDEASDLAQKYGSIGISYLIAKDAISIYINNQNPIRNLTLEQLKSIFTGEYNNWSQVAGLDVSIEVVLRPPTSGTYVYINDFVLENEEYTDNAITIPTNKALFEYIYEHNNAIGFAGIFSSNSVKKCLIDGIEANVVNVKNDTYPLIRYLYFYTIDEPTGKTKDFIDWVLDKEGQIIVKNVGFIPLWL